MDKSGQIWLGVKVVPAEKNPDAQEAVVRIKDNKIGISADLLSRIFDVFTQADATSERSKGGLGIGLTLARHLVDLHGGSIQATSEGLGKGSEFIVRLPLAELVLDVNAGRRRAPEALRPIPSYKRILVVDDVRIQAKSMGMLLELMGFEVRIAHDGSGALAALQEFLPDVALIDIGLPEINRYEVARRIRALPQFKDILLIAQTGWGRDTDRERARQAGFDYHLTKPIDHQRLEKILTGRADPRDTSAELNSSK